MHPLLVRLCLGYWNVFLYHGRVVGAKEETSADPFSASERRCDDDVKKVEYYDEEDVEDPKVKAVRCKDVDAEL